MTAKKLIIGLGLAALASYLALRVYVCGTWNHDRDVANQERIAQAYVSFYRDRGLCPSSLLELVQSGYLPARASYYREPPGFWRGTTSAAASSYQVFRPERINVDALSFIARRESNGRYEFDPPVNAEVRDQLLAINRERAHSGRKTGSPP